MFSRKLCIRGLGLACLLALMLVLPALSGCFFLATDTDGDGVPNTTDNCIFVANGSQEDSDNDGIGNVCDNCPNDSNSEQLDGDGDGVGDACDNCPNDANADQTDNDGDGFGAVCDSNDSNPLVH